MEDFDSQPGNEEYVEAEEHDIYSANTEIPLQYPTLDEIPIEIYTDDLIICKIFGSRIIQTKLYHLVGLENPRRLGFIAHVQLRAHNPTLLVDYLSALLQV